MGPPVSASPKPPRHEHLNLIHVGHVVGQRRDARARPRLGHQQTVDRDASFVLAAAVRREAVDLARVRLRADAAGRHQRRDVGHDACITACDRQRLEDVVAQHRFPPCGLHVDDRRLSRDRERFLEASQAQLDVDRDRTRPGERQPVPHDPREAGQHVSDRVVSRRKIGDPVLAGPIADGAAGLFDQGRAARFDRHPRQHSARGVSNHARQCCLCVCEGR